jgi:hypothetical protein
MLGKLKEGIFYVFPNGKEAVGDYQITGVELCEEDICDVYLELDINGYLDGTRCDLTAIDIEEVRDAVRDELLANSYDYDLHLYFSEEQDRTLKYQQDLDYFFYTREL